MKKALSVVILLVLILSVFSSCENKTEPSLTNCGVMHEEKFGGIYINISIDDFNSLGFEYGDSVDISFSNGKTLTDIPYYSGYYVDMGETLLVAYPGYPYIKACVNYGDDLWITDGLDENCTADVKLNESGKYVKIQNARNIKYSDEQGDQSDEVFGNFGAVSAGDLKDNILYRSASPCDNEHNRAAVVDRLIEKAGVNFVLNLSDNEDDMEELISMSDYNSPYYLSLYEKGKVAALGMSANFKSDDFNEKLAKGLTEAAKNDGPYLVHCVEGKDRTGYVMMILEALAGASYDEIIDDYMLTYENYYGITQTSDIDRYETIKEKNIDIMIAYVTGNDQNVDYRTADLSQYAADFLVKIGMTNEDIETLQNKLTK